MLHVLYVIPDVLWSEVECVRIPYPKNKAVVWSLHPGPSPEVKQHVSKRDFQSLVTLGKKMSKS